MADNSDISDCKVSTSVFFLMISIYCTVMSDISVKARGVNEITYGPFY